MLWQGLIDGEIILWSLASVPVLMVGTYVGNWGFGRATPQHHRVTALVTLSVLAVSLIARGLRG